MNPKLNEDQVLHSFYEERKCRDFKAKRHSLLQKNLSYFSSNQEIQMRPSQKCIERKTNLQKYTKSLYEPVQPCHNDFVQTFRDSRKRYHVQDQPLILLAQQEREEVRSPSFKYPQEQEDEIETQKIRIQDQEKKMASTIPYRHNPLYEKQNEENFMNKLKKEENNKKVGKIQKSPKYLERDQPFEYQIKNLKEKVEELQYENKMKSRFIESVYDMRRTMQNTNEDCSLKQLWRWVKKLPYRQDM